MRLEILAPSTLIALLFIASCGSAPVATTSQVEPVSVATEAKKAESTSEPLITFETSSVWCEPCPSVRISIFEDKPAVLEGKYYEQVSAKPGTYEERSITRTHDLKPQQLAKLNEMLIEMSFVDLADSYVPKTDPTGRFVPSGTCPQSLSDGPTYKISYRQGSRIKSVTHYDSCEPNENVRKLAVFEKYVMELFSTEEILIKRSSANANVSTSNNQ